MISCVMLRNTVERMQNRFGIALTSATDWAVAAAILVGAAIIALVLHAALLWLARDLPRPETALDAGRRPSLSLQDRNGQVFATYGDMVGEPLRLSDMPKYLPEAAVAGPVFSVRP